MADSVDLECECNEHRLVRDSKVKDWYFVIALIEVPLTVSLYEISSV